MASATVQWVDSNNAVVYANVEGWGNVPILGRGRIVNLQIADCGRPVVRRFHCLTRAEYMVYMRDNWPATYEYELELIGASMSSAAL